MPAQKRPERISGAIDRQAEARERSPQDQLARLDQRLGEGVGAKRERARLGGAA